MDILLSPVEARVLASLMEKAATTPDYYPLTLNAVVMACNQKSNRDPAMDLDEAAVSAAIEELRYRDHLVWEVTLPGSRVPKYRQDIGARLPMDPQEQAVLCELMLRGPQTQGELRARIERMCGPVTADQVAAAVDGMMARDGAPLIVRLAPGPGRREMRYAHLLCGMPEAVEAGPALAAPARAAAAASPMQLQIAALEQRVAALESELAGMKALISGAMGPLE